MSDTPRVDFLLSEYGHICTDMEVKGLVNLSRQLERELSEARAEIARLNKNLRLLLCETHLDECEAGLFNSKNPDDEPCLICLMEAAERGK